MSVCLEKNNFKNDFNNSFNCNNYSIQTTCVSVTPSVLVVSEKGKILKQVSLMISRSRQRKALAKLDSRLVADIGYSADQVKRELDKPFWK